MMQNTYRVAEIFAYREGWTNEDETYTRAGVESGDLAGAIMLAARRGPNLGKRADVVDYVFVADQNGLWGVGRAVHIAQREKRDGSRTRCFIVDPYGIPADVLSMVGSPRPVGGRGGSGVQYGLLADGEFTMDSQAN